MIHLITGGSGSGKSEYAEKLLTGSVKKENPYFYIATMKPYGEETLKKIERHHKLRRGKGFKTIERYTDLKNLSLPKNQGVLLECISNLAANELFLEDGTMCDPEKVKDEIMGGILKIASQTENLVIVTNEVASDVEDYSEETRQYISIIESVNRQMANMADTVTEVVYGIPVTLK